ncbi:hypothetical protein ACMGDH_15470 [Sphingomonas sp. DT-207]|uniref:hypothetical protein n=1 Tax=Sphingomonas sp. DT-207 TaxID=3396167 RepID=UPI003F1C8CA2
MKIIHLLTAAGIFMASAVAAAPAEAQHYRDYRGYDRDYRGYRDYDRRDYRHRDYRDRRHWDRRHYDRRRYGWNRGHHGWRNQRCWTEYRWGGPVRVCRR